jgi:L-alanine-DL-glutamate epimerase-like enolase superfamily enzyme
MAVYDLLGKHLGIPAWKLIGPRARSWVPVAFWTVSQPPRAMAEEVRQAVRLGYRWLKYHVDEIQNAVDQTAAMQEAAPRGFKVQYDINSDQPLETVLPVLKALERFPVAGRIEDPITLLDRDGWRVIRSKCTIPIVGENAPVEFMLERLCDGYMISHRPVGPTAKIAAVAEQMGVPLIIQHTGGTINQAFLAHQAAVYRAATLEHVGLCHLWKDDVTAETMKVVGGSVALPEGPGLGVTLDREKLARYARTAPPELGRYLVRMRYAGGLTVYFRHDADAAGTPGQVLSKGSVRVPGPGPSYGNAVVTDFWDEAGSPEFERLWKETERGPVYVQGRER